MISAVLLFGLMNIVFEFILLSMLKPRTRLRLLGNPSAKTATHVAFLAFNLVIHWGTLIGTMSGIFAFITSIATTYLAAKLFGVITEDRYYTVGLIKYSRSELA